MNRGVAFDVQQWLLRPLAKPLEGQAWGDALHKPRRDIAYGFDVALIYVIYT